MDDDEYDEHVAFPPGWRQGRRLRVALGEAVLDEDAPWNQSVGAVSHLLACVINCCEDDRVRVRLAEQIARMVVIAAREGGMPQVTMDEMQ